MMHSSLVLKLSFGLLILLVGGTISIEAIKLFEGDLVLTPPQREAAKQGRDIIAGVSRGASRIIFGLVGSSTIQ
ncbi:hypothetical protein OS493_003426 [Desmophyllum pertusum]|uniref:Uncharacterized protein n=1 Tax=Desmophyllum pertusum TaxID=174260 RepID=A0A9X0A5J0_9CNID|nr:hypothetical protein OS493_003426 [Desmophyllum pertusum]